MKKCQCTTQAGYSTKDLNSQIRNSIKPSFLISSTAILSEVLSKLQFYDDSSVYDRSLSKDRSSFFKSNAWGLSKLIDSHQISSFPALDHQK